MGPLEQENIPPQTTLCCLILLAGVAYCTTTKWAGQYYKVKGGLHILWFQGKHTGNYAALEHT